jgi:alanine-synthesizing transaminase
MFAARTGWQLAKNRFTKALERRRAASAKLLDLTPSNPTSAKLEYASVTIREALAQAESLHYQPEPFGLSTARAAVEAYYRESHKLDISPERVLLTSSTSEAYSFLFRLLCNPGDEVLVARPSYPLFDFLAEIKDVQLRRFRLFYVHVWVIDLLALDQDV